MWDQAAMFIAIGYFEEPIVKPYMGFSTNMAGNENIFYIFHPETHINFFGASEIW